MTRRFILPLLLALAAALPLFGSSNDAAWIADIDRLATELPRLHVNAFTKISAEDFEAGAATLKEDLPGLSDDQVAVRLLRLVASIGDAHTTTYGYEPPRVPVTLRWLADGFYVVRAAAAETDLFGARLVAVDDHAIDEVMAAVAPIVSHENQPWLREVAPRHLNTPAVLHALGIASSPEMMQMRFVLPDGSAVDRVLVAAHPSSIVWLDPLPEERLPLYRRDVQRNYWFEYLAWSETLYIAYNRCQESSTQSAEAFGDELATFAQSQQVSRLVLDLRNNYGGNSALILALFMKTYQALPDIDHPDRFYVIIGPSTFSSAMMNAIQIRDGTQATLIGTPTGGKPNHFGNVRTFTLPNSRIVVQYSTASYTLDPAGDPQSLMPDVEVAVSAADWFAGRDAVLERIVPRPGRRRAAGH